MRDRKTEYLLLAILGAVPVIWIGLLVAPYSSGGLPQIVSGFGESMDDPLRIRLCENSIKTVLVFLLIYLFAVGVYLSSKRNYRRREEHGSAHWQNARSLNKKYRDHVYEDNRILTRNVFMGLDGRKHKRNLNTLVCGGSGAGKTRFYAAPNLMQANGCSYIILDPKSELLRSTGKLLEERGYSIKVLDLINMNMSHCYNPFMYLKTDNDIQKLVTNLFKNTTQKNAQSQDPFWEDSAKMLLMALVSYLHYEAPEYEQNFSMVLYMLRAGEVMENNDSYRSPLDKLFDNLETVNPDHIALKYYRSYRSGSAKTLKSIQITLMSHLDKFNLDSLEAITKYDELDLPGVGLRKTAVFAVIPDNDTSFNFLVGILYTQLFQQLYYLADSQPDGRLPVHVHFLMDEFANVPQPDSFQTVLSTMRSREISVSIIIQNMAQLKALYKDDWEGIVGNCDEFLYLGGNEQATHKYVSELLGKETIDTNTYARAKGHNGSYTTNWQIAGRDLMTPDEVRMLDNRYALLFVRGESPVKDLKYDIMKHPNLALTTNGGAEAYVYGEDTMSIGTLSLDNSGEAPLDEMTFAECKVEILTEEDWDEKYGKEE